MEVYVACFDISDDGLRARVGNLLLRYGDRVQKSVFEIAVKDRFQLDDIRNQLTGMVDDDDSIRFYRLCADCRSISTTLTGDPVAQFPAVVII